MKDSNKDTSLNSSFYRHFYNEELYVIKEKNTDPQVKNESSHKVDAAEDQTVKKPFIVINGKPDADLLIIFDNPKAQGLNMADKDFFINILKAVGIKPSEIAALNTATIKGNTWEDIAAVTKANKIIAFGIDKEMLPEKVQAGTVEDISGKTILSVESLSIISEDTKKKKVLWSGMQKIFNL